MIMDTKDNLTDIIEIASDTKPAVSSTPGQVTTEAGDVVTLGNDV